jgi:hypothetical protein
MRQRDPNCRGAISDSAAIRPRVGGLRSGVIANLVFSRTLRKAKEMQGQFPPLLTSKYAVIQCDPTSLRARSVKMDNLDYPWQRVYVAAVREAYGSRMRLRLCEALAAIEQRRLNPLEIDGEEDQALKDAERVLETLKAELLDGAA